MNFMNNYKFFVSSDKQGFSDNQGLDNCGCTASYVGMVVE